MKYTLEQCVELVKKYPIDCTYTDPEAQKASDEFYEKNGFRKEETWNLDATITAFLLPRIAYLRDTTNGFPASLPYDNGYDQWIEILDKIITWLYKYLEDAPWDPDTSMTVEEIDEAKSLFVKYFESLWD